MAPFEPVTCDVFITEATFALPVFRHEPAEREAGRLVESLSRIATARISGVYGLGKCQRMLRLVRDAGYQEPIYLHGALAALTELYQQLGHDFGDIRPVGPQEKHAGALVFVPLWR